MDPSWGEKNVIPGKLVVDTVTGRTAEVHKILPKFGVQVWVKERGYERENWPFAMCTVRTPRLIKRYPRPRRFPRLAPSLHCHCKIGKMVVEDVDLRAVRCQRCKYLIGNESFPRRIERATSMLEKADPVRFIPLTQGQIAIVSREDYKKLSKYNWFYRKNKGVYKAYTGYAYTRDYDGGMTQMANLVLKVPKGFIVDHKDRNGLNNARDNLRPATKQQNSANEKLSSNNTTGYKGVSVCRRGGFSSRIQVDGKQIRLGIFSSAKKAAKTYDKAAIRYFGPFAKTNFPIRTEGDEVQPQGEVQKGVQEHSKQPQVRGSHPARKKRETKSPGGVVIRPGRASKTTKRNSKSLRGKAPRNRRSGAVPKKVSIINAKGKKVSKASTIPAFETIPPNQEAEAHIQVKGDIQ